MKILKRLLLRNWHYISFELIEFDKITYLTGKTGSGKSTMVDALQLLILGDTNARFFNKAANEKSERTIEGYLKGLISKQDQDYKGEYLRGDVDFSSYIVGEFYDDLKDEIFTFGLVFDCYAGEKPEHRYFWMDTSLQDGLFVVDNDLVGISQLVDYLKRMNIKFKVYSSNKEYREDFKAKMGSLKDKFFNIFKKAVPFEPIHDIEQFISSFLCDSDTKIDTHEMQENIRHYKSLEMESEKISERISFLEDIGIKFENYRVEKEKLLVQQYLLDRAEVHQSEEDIADLEQKIAIKKKEHIKLLGLIEKQRLELEELDKKIETLNKEYYGSDLKKELDNLKSQLELAKGRLDAINISINRLYSMLHNVATTWKIGCGLRNDEQVDFPDELLALEDNLIAGIKYILSYKKENIVEISTDGIDNFKEQMNGYKSKIGEYRADKSNSKKALEGEINKLELEIANLKMGIKSYPDKVTTLKSILTDELSKKYGTYVKVELVSDLIEIKDKKWRNAIEGYLHTQKFYLIVKPEYFIDALRIYDIYKNENNIYDVGIIDVEKVIQSRKPAQAGSLADEIMTDNEYVRAYMDFILGNVMKAESVEQLRNYKTAITETCMLYNNFVARQLDPKRWDIPYIGQQAIK
ncbi:MAG: hypothetical protein GX815_01775, partial [Clostridiales bacterium]|nr:hypothetical protein [Clostridiales bacterium]